jgi:hypothetical protein
MELEGQSSIEELLDIFCLRAITAGAVTGAAPP